jgi:hypothetical protein
VDREVVVVVPVVPLDLVVVVVPVDVLVLLLLSVLYTEVVRLEVLYAGDDELDEREVALRYVPPLLVTVRPDAVLYVL